MRKLTMSAIGAAAVLSFALPTAASAQWNRHDDRHDQLDDQHGDVHEELEDEHAQAHEEGLSPWGHARVHQGLQNQHEEADYSLELQHQRQDARERWRRQSYGNQGYGYRGYGNRGYQYPRYRRQGGFSIYFGN